MMVIQILLSYTPREHTKPFLALEILTQPSRNWAGRNATSSVICAEQLAALLETLRHGGRAGKRGHLGVQL